MPIFVQNFSWMSVNVILAILPLFFVALLRKKRPLYLYVFFLMLWIFFMPNTIYLITDLQHFPGQFIKADSIAEQFAIFIQYILLTFFGVFTYFYALDPIERAARKYKLTKATKYTLYIFVNYIISVGLIMGKIQRTHSIYVVTQPTRVIWDVYEVFTNHKLLLLVVLTGVVINIIFFTTRHYFFKVSLGEVRNKRSKK